jgi:hypothetical protein
VQFRLHENNSSQSRFSRKAGLLECDVGWLLVEPDAKALKLTLDDALVGQGLCVQQSGKRVRNTGNT